MNNVIIEAINAHGVKGVILGEVETPSADWISIQKNRPVLGEQFFQFKPYDGGSAIVQKSACVVLGEISAEQAITRYHDGMATKQFFNYFVEAINKHTK